MLIKFHNYYFFSKKIPEVPFPSLFLGVFLQATLDLQLKSPPIQFLDIGHFDIVENFFNRFVLQCHILKKMFLVSRPVIGQ